MSWRKSTCASLLAYTSFLYIRTQGALDIFLILKYVYYSEARKLCNKKISHYEHFTLLQSDRKSGKPG